MRTLINTFKGGGGGRRCRRGVVALWLLAAFSWFGVLVPGIHQAAGSPAALLSRADESRDGTPLLSTRCDAGSGECVLCAWLASASYSLADAPRSAPCHAMARERTPAAFRQASLCVRGVPCRIPRGPPSPAA